MMKITIFACVLIMIVNLTSAQNTSGKIHYKVTEDWIKKIMAVDYLNKSRKEHYQYMWGSDSEYSRKSMLIFNTACYRYEEVKDEEANYGFSWRTDEYFIFRNLKENYTYDVMRILDKLYVIEDSIQNPNWKILNDLKEVAGHICMNASYYDDVKMNNIVAWFALDWPGSFGPERFGGLPGVILEIDINNGAKVIRAEKIDLYETDSLIEKPVHKKKIKRISESQYNEMIKKNMDQCKKEERPYFWGMRY
ncbi:MAG: GLPGLI family protein [Bacteroidales bacterium]|nr:GLPGLI family protein [Bacteroidales bacterium]